jgi:sugar phosphate isomerase/epimerase
MKLACSSAAFDDRIEHGDLTQLEFIDLCARELACDGVVLDVRHFPRIDDDYLAQVKKMATDRGLSLAALADAAFFTSNEARITETLHQADALGAPLIAAPLALETSRSWSEQLALIGVATSQAKAFNVTLAVRNAPATFAASVHDCKRLSKEADSAWLRFGPEPGALDAASDPAELATNSVLLWSTLGLENERSMNELIGVFSTFRGYLALDEGSGLARVDDMRRALEAWRSLLNRT